MVDRFRANFLLGFTCLYHIAGHILMKVYNCTETKKKSHLKKHVYRLLKISHDLSQSSTKNVESSSLFSSPKISDDLLFTRFLDSFIHLTFSQHFSIFTPLFHSRTQKFTNTTAQFPILQLQITFYNCRNCH